MVDYKIAKQVIDFQKATFDNTFSAITMLQDQAEKATSMLLQASAWPIPEEGKKMLNEWIQTFKKGRDEYKKAVDENFKRMESFFCQEKDKTEQTSS